MSDLGHEDATGASDDQLIAEARVGGRAAFAELWNRHYAVGLSAARQLGTGADADDIVAEAFARIYDRVVAGGGPSGPFRPYLYAVIRNLASRWGTRASRELTVEFDEHWDAPLDDEDTVMVALERSLTARAFTSLPERWQTVLWYTEVEGMDPHEVAPLMGLTANGVAALSYRAREGLRVAWLQAHLSDDGVPETCARTVSHLGEYTRGSLAARESRSVDAHLDTCTRCVILVDELDDVSGRLRMVVAPLVLGGAAAGLTTLGGSGSTAAAASIAVPALPAAIGAPAVSAVGVGMSAVLVTAAAVAAPLVLAGALVMALPGSGISESPPGSETGVVNTLDGDGDDAVTQRDDAGEEAVIGSELDSLLGDGAPADAVDDLVSDPLGSLDEIPLVGPIVPSPDLQDPLGTVPDLPELPGVQTPPLPVPTVPAPIVPTPTVTAPSLPLP